MTQAPVFSSPYGAEMTDAETSRVGNFEVALSSVGNPDRRQDPSRSLPGVPKQTVKVDTLVAASKACSAYIREHELGGGNFTGGAVFEDGVMVARISYNGRVWRAS